MAANLFQLLQTALAHHQAGRLPAAEKLYRQVLAAQPANFDALHLCGVVAYQTGRAAEAVELYQRALRANTKSPVCEMRLGLALAALNRHTEAEKRLRAATAGDPRLIDGWMGLAVTLRVLGRLPEAIESYQKVVAIDPKHAEAHGQIGALLSDTQGPAAAIPHLRRAVELNPGHGASWCNLGLALLAGQKFKEALACFDRALAAEPALTQALVGRALAHQQMFELTQAAAEFGAALAREPAHHQARSGRLLTLNYLSDCTRERLFQEHLAFGRAVEVPASHRGPTPAPHATPESRGQRLRLAFLSPDLRAHSVAYFLEPLLRHLDRRRFEIFLYHDHFKTDATSERLKALGDHWRNFVGQLDDVVETSIRADAPDILVDLAGHTGLNRLPLFARRLAPVQATYLGYPNTTGLAEMDYRLVDPITDPGDGETDPFHTEKLVRFSSCAWCYQPPASAPEPARRAGEPLTFGSFNNLAKVTDETLRLWARLLAGATDAKLLIKGQGLGEADVRTALQRRFEAAGVPLARVEWLERTPDLASHLEVYHRVDIALDPFPYHGTTTSCEALWMGVPVVSLCGDRHASRVGASLLTAVGHPEWIAATGDEYVEKALRLAATPAHLAHLRATLREDVRKSVLMDFEGQAERFQRALEAKFRTQRSVSLMTKSERDGEVSSQRAQS